MDPVNEEYQLQHFNFSVKQMNFANRIMIMGQIHKLKGLLLEEVITKLNVPMDAAIKLRENMEIAATTTFTDLKSSIREVEETISKTFSIPPNVLLANDLAHSRPYSLKDQEELSKELTELENTFDQHAVFIISLNKELDFYRNIKPFLIEEEKWLNCVEHYMNMEASPNDDLFDIILKKIEEIKE